MNTPIGLLAISAGLLLGIGAPAVEDEPDKDADNIVGTWTCVDSRTDDNLMSIQLQKTGQCKEIGQNRLVGVNGLGANHYSYKDELLTFEYVKAGRERVDNMLSGKVTWVGRNEFKFKILGGYYGQSRKGLTLVFKRE